MRDSTACKTASSPSISTRLRPEWNGDYVISVSLSTESAGCVRTLCLRRSMSSCIVFWCGPTAGYAVAGIAYAFCEPCARCTRVALDANDVFDAE
jgi:hypothetical protein